MSGFTGKVYVVNTRVHQAKPKVAEGGMRGWDGLPWKQSTGRGLSIMNIDGPLVAQGNKWRYVTWTGIGSGIGCAVMLVLECIEDMNLSQLLDNPLP